jgi:hypothetical protein
MITSRSKACDPMTLDTCLRCDSQTVSWNAPYGMQMRSNSLECKCIYNKVLFAYTALELKYYPLIHGSHSHLWRAVLDSVGPSDADFFHLLFCVIIKCVFLLIWLMEIKFFFLSKVKDALCDADMNTRNWLRWYTVIGP